MQRSRIGPIVLEEPLGGEADSNVLRGIHLERNKRMAVKLLPCHLVNRTMGGDTFAEDVKSLQKLVHPHIARVYGGAMDAGQPYLAMELVEGESLRCLLDRRGRLSWESTADIAEAICEALQYAHNAGMVHQRLTPSRVMLTPTDEVKLLGFDCHLGDNDDVLGLRSRMTVANYLAPEVFRGKQSAALATTDMFSLGVIMYECLTGELPWKAATPGELIQSRRDQPAARVSAKVLECPVWLDVLVARLLETKRGIRLATADATRRAIFDAKQKVAQGMGAAQQAWSGRQGALTVDADRKEINALRRQQTAPRQRDDSPFYEGVWFLAACLVAIVGVGVWIMWPKSEDALFAAAQPLMQSERSVDWKQAKNQYLDELERRFPNSKYAKQLAEFDDKVARNQAIESVKNIDRFHTAPSSEAQRLYAEGWHMEQFDDLLGAWRKYELVLKKADVKVRQQRALVTLAREGISRIKSAATSPGTQLDVVKVKLDRAVELANAGKALQARSMLDDIVSLYGSDPDRRQLVDQARQQIRALDAQRAAAPE